MIVDMKAAPNNRGVVVWPCISLLVIIILMIIAPSIRDDMRIRQRSGYSNIGITYTVAPLIGVGFASVGTRSKGGSEFVMFAKGSGKRDAARNAVAGARLLCGGDAAGTGLTFDRGGAEGDARCLDAASVLGEPSGGCSDTTLQRCEDHGWTCLDEGAVAAAPPREPLAPVPANLCGDGCKCFVERPLPCNQTDPRCDGNVECLETTTINTLTYKLEPTKCPVGAQHVLGRTVCPYACLCCDKSLGM